MTHTNPAPAPTGFFYELRTGAWRQSNVIFALIFKEFKTRVEAETFGGIVWMMIEPIERVLVLGMLWYIVGRTEIQGVNVILFLAVAMVPFTIVKMSMSSLPGVIRQSKAFFNFQQVKPIDALIARYILNTSLAMFGEVVLFFLIAWFLGFYMKFGNLLEFTSLFLLSIAMGLGISLIIATYGTMYDIVIKLLSYASRPLLFVSAVIHPASELPARARYYLSWNPIVHIIEYMRYYALGMKPFPEASIRWPVIFTMVVLFLGLTGYYANRQKLIQRR